MSDDWVKYVVVAWFLFVIIGWFATTKFAY